MKTTVATILLSLYFSSGYSQFGDAYHAPNSMQLALDRQKRMDANDNAHYNNMRSSNKSSSSAGISGDYNAYGWADYSGMKEMEAAEKRQNERIDAYNAKQNRLNELIRSRNLKREPAYYSQLIKAAKDAGFDDYSASRFFGHDTKEYEQILLRKKIGDNGAYAGGTKLNCQGDCTETLAAYNGDVYVGNTLNGKPHGKGKYTTKISGIVVEGNFSNGQIDGEAIAKGEKYTAKGIFSMGRQVGVHTITTQEDDGITGIYKMNFDDMEGCSYTGSDGMSFTGKMDAAYNFIKGEIVYGSGIKFNGYFKDNSPYRGTWIKEHRIMVGEFAAADDGTLYLKYGYLDNQKDKIIYQGNFGPGMKKTGFINQQSASGTVTEFYYSAPEVEEYVCIYFTSGTKMYLKARADGDDYIGVQNLKDDNAGSIPVRYSKTEGVIYLKADEKELIAKSSQYAKEAIAKMKQGQADYNKSLENVEEFFRYDKKETAKKPEQSAKPTKPAIVTPPAENAKEKAKPVDTKANVSAISDAKNYKTPLDKLNAYLKTFDDGYYGYIEVINDEVYIRLKSGNSYIAKIKDLDKAVVVTENKKIEIKCLDGKNCMAITLNGASTDKMVIYQSADFNTAEFIQLINNFLESIKIKKDDKNYISSNDGFTSYTSLMDLALNIIADGKNNYANITHPTYNLVNIDGACNTNKALKLKFKDYFPIEYCGFTNWDFPVLRGHFKTADDEEAKIIFENFINEFKKNKDFTQYRSAYTNDNTDVYFNYVDKADGYIYQVWLEKKSAPATSKYNLRFGVDKKR